MIIILPIRYLYKRIFEPKCSITKRSLFSLNKIFKNNNPIYINERYHYTSRISK